MYNKGYSRNWLKTGHLICEFIDAFKQVNDGAPPAWNEIVSHLNEINHPTKQGGQWRESSAQSSLVRYCETKDVAYPLPMRKGSRLFTKRTDEIDPDTNDITITLKITVSANQKVNVIVE